MDRPQSVNLEMKDLAVLYPGSRPRTEAYIEELERENRKLRMQYAGAMGLISEMSGHLALNRPEDREPMLDSIRQAAEDWCQMTGWTGRMVGKKLVLDPPQPEENSG